MGTTTRTIKAIPAPTVMTRRILIHDNATIDIHEHFAYLAETNQDQAFRFFDAARQTFAALAHMPGMGR